jgi:HAD superfamily hydrolase (TIGR01509 family)
MPADANDDRRPCCLPSGLSPSVPEFHRINRCGCSGSRTVTAGSDLHRPRSTNRRQSSPTAHSVPCGVMQRPDPVRAVVFDFDGLLADTEKPWGVAEESMFTSRGVAYGDTERGLFLGTAVTDTASIMARYFDEPHPEVLADLLRRAREQLALNSQPMRGAVDLLGRIRVPYAVASNTPRDLLDLSMQASGLAELVPVSVSASEVRSPKPAPDLYLRACELLGVPPSEAVAIEDSRTGAAAARAAGLWVVMIPSGASEPSDADLFLESLADPVLAEWFGWSASSADGAAAG